ncbi:putative OPA3-like protein CG13603 [Centruroides vittatus]|uniref:putative OPA3-like protein CG13603 n=1 Tax=Centruroides vittatus TaxID=120091 RepID=UPI00350FDE94
MVAGAFPIVKLGALALKQLSKPLANGIKSRAKNSHFFRTYICMPPAQLYNWLEVNVKMRLLNLGKPSEVQKLNENMAIELGAELLGETIIFSIAAITLTAEYVRSSIKEREKEEARQEYFSNLEKSIEDLRFTVEKQQVEIRHLTRLCYSSSKHKEEHEDKKEGKS